MISHFKNLSVWQKAMDFAEEVYRQTESFPAKEIYGLTAQVRRSAISIPSNIAEGAERDGTKDFMRFVSIARGSLGEVETQLILAHRLLYLTTNQYEQLVEALHEIGRMLSGLQRSLNSKLEAV